MSKVMETKSRKQKRKFGHIPHFHPCLPLCHARYFGTYLSPGRTLVTEKEMCLWAKNPVFGNFKPYQCLTPPDLQDVEHLVLHPVGIPGNTNSCSIRPNP